MIHDGHEGIKKDNGCQSITKYPGKYVHVFFDDNFKVGFVAF